MLYLLPVHGEQTLSLYACSKVCNKDDETIGVQGNADKITKQLEAQLAELNAKLEQSAREIVELLTFTGDVTFTLSTRVHRLTSNLRYMGLGQTESFRTIDSYFCYS